MAKSEDQRLIATRSESLEAALELLQEEGVLAVTHAAISAKTGISRSTLYRHWPKLDELRNAAFARAASTPRNLPRTNGPLKTDLIWILGHLMMALNETPWGYVAPQIIAAASTDEQARALLSNWIKDRSADVEEVFNAAKVRGEINEDLDVSQLIEMVIAGPYFRKFIAGLPLDHDWLDAHADLICNATMSLAKEAL
ncbi:MAG: TetR/AcrR family transcriptional regulator [Flavobacteriales bacterium]|nr:TetR/AcrR family transcriptional regulator [Flavobacteriales bacterium]